MPLLALLLVHATSRSPLTVADLRCEYRVAPLGVDAERPRLSWTLSAGLRHGQTQAGYQIQVASTLDKLEQGADDCWDSGQVHSDQQNQVEYSGRPLSSGTRAFWRVRVWDGNGTSSSWSKPSSWSMGLLRPGDWHADWIGVEEPGQGEKLATPRYLRKEFALPGKIKRATVYATALGLYELRLNGSRVGDHLLAPEWTNYFKRVQYQTFDVTRMLKPGQNAVGALLGNGWYCGDWQMFRPGLARIYGTQPYLRFQLVIEGADGSVQEVDSDGSWKGSTDGPVRFAGIYEGETIDARKAMPGWDQAGFEGKGWRPVTVAHPKVGAMVWQRSEPIHVTQKLRPRSVQQVKPGIWVYDLGQNIAGWCEFRPREAAGTTVKFEFNEVLNPDGTVYMDNLHAGHLSTGDRQVDRYTCAGGDETFEPHFTYHGFRYIQVTGLTHAPALGDLTACVFHTGFERTGEFTCSNPLLNRLAQNIQWSQRANMMGVPTDCCQRDERCGYTGDGQFFMPTAVYNFDVAAFFNKWLVDVDEDSQLPGGWFGDHAPTFGPGQVWNVGWADAGVICPFIQWQTYGDTAVIREHYPAMRRYMDLLESASPDLIHHRSVGNGDWLNLGGGASNDVIGTAYDAYDFEIMAQMAAAIGNRSDSLRYAARAEAIKAAFANAFLDDEGNIKESSQTGYALAYTMGLVPPDRTTQMSDRFADAIARFQDHLATGFIGTPRLLPALHLAGRDDLAYKLLLQTTYPSWLYPVTLGATTMWERWDGWRPEKGFEDAGMNSFNHYAFGSVGQYLFANVGGITPLSPGYKKIGIQPVIEPGLTWAHTAYRSIFGLIRSDWKVTKGGLELEVEIPVNTTAEVQIPLQGRRGVWMDGAPVGVSGAESQQGRVRLTLGSGVYHFRAA